MASRWNHVVRLGPAVENGCVVLASVNGRTYELYKCVDCTQMRFARFDGSGWDKARPLAIASPKYAIANQQGRVSLDPPVSIPLGATSGGPVYKKEIGYMEFHHLLGADDGQNIGFQLLAKRHVEEADTHQADRTDALEARMDRKIEALEARIDRKIEALEGRIDRKIETVNAAIGELSRLIQRKKRKREAK